MSDEAKVRPGGRDHAGDAHGERAGEQSPLQGRAAFIKNWDWQLVTSLNRGSCDRGKAVHGLNSETHEQVRRRWQTCQQQELTLGETLDFLLECHRSAPKHFINTFGEIARRLLDAVFFEFPLARRREAGSLSAHYVAGVLDRESLEGGLKTLAQLIKLNPGDRVRTLTGSTHGEIVQCLPDGRVVWRPDGTQSELTGLPESLLPEKGRRG